MKPLPALRSSSARFRAGFLIASLLLIGAGKSFAVPTTTYSTSASYATSYTCGNAVICLGPGEGVVNTELAANSILTDKGLSSGSTVSLKLGLSATGQISDRAGMVVAPGGSLLTVSALGTYTLVTYKNGQPMETHQVAAEVVQSLKLLAGNSRPMQLEFIAGTQFDAVELVVSGAASLGYTLNVYYAYGVSALVQQPARGLVSKFNAPLAPYYSTAITPVDPLISACANTNISNPEYAVDADLTNYARFGTLISVNCPSSLSVKLENLRTATQRLVVSGR